MPDVCRKSARSATWTDFVLAPGSVLTTGPRGRCHPTTLYKESSDVGQPTRLPLEPLLALTGGMEPIAAILGYDDGKHLYRSTNIGHYYRDGVPWWRADELAAACGFHPVNVWGADWESLADTVPVSGGRGKRFRRTPRWGLIGAEIAAVR